MNKFDALKLDDSNNDDSTDDKEDEDGDNSKKENGTKTFDADTADEEEWKKYQAELEAKEVKPNPGENPLQCPYVFWFSRRPPGKIQSPSNYENNIKIVGKFASVEQFWAFYSYMVMPGELTAHCDIHLFKDGIKPIWEDEANKGGGKWIVRLRKGLASRCWENLVLAMLGEQFMVGSEVCGAVISIRFQEDIISIWNRNASDQATTTRIRDTLKRVLNLPPNTIMEYKAHQDSMKDNSSFRNTDVFVR
ncbi:eukaryotic translation initiation factor 4E type 2-like isoform X2 [Actinia tenebrosa]|uniref:Eukaryotic translation initiation factor 4E type 2-like isoform X2 n=1 Tax=Actinia tenebrosa TaxID=6105 RepID=A0A6P8IN90_ACTTE|nr:eukaryotic translation initiation factor 4E type 2-like isoform X2 [Actinia tenebrosa]